MSSTMRLAASTARACPGNASSPSRSDSHIHSDSTCAPEAWCHVPATTWRLHHETHLCWLCLGNRHETSRWMIKCCSQIHSHKTMCGCKINMCTYTDYNQPYWLITCAWDQQVICWRTW